MLTQQAEHDTLTGLANRTLFLDRLGLAVARLPAIASSWAAGPLRLPNGARCASRVAEVCVAHTEAAATAVEATAATAEPEVISPKASTRERTRIGAGSSEGRVPASGSVPP